MGTMFPSSEYSKPSLPTVALLPDSTLQQVPCNVITRRYSEAWRWGGVWDLPLGFGILLQENAG